jgi:hypothetical protein
MSYSHTDHNPDKLHIENESPKSALYDSCYTIDTHAEHHHQLRWQIKKTLLC